METYLNQIQAGIDQNLYLLSLSTALTLPDICGAVSSNNGEATGNKYRDWYDTYVTPIYSKLTSTECYNFRCKLLHQARTESKGGSTDYSFIAFAEPLPKTQGSISINIGRSEINGKPGPKSIDVIEFVEALLKAVHIWMNEKKGSEPYDTNIAKVIKRDENGLPGLIATPYIY